MFEALCLSLKVNTDRRNHMLNVFDKMDIDVLFFNALTPNDITFDDEKYFENCDFYEWNINQKAVMATFLSHMSMLQYSVRFNKNLLIIEDDLDYILPIDFDSIKFHTFDIYNVGLEFSCYSYFVSVEGAEKILKELDFKIITQAYDWELSKLNTIKKITSDNPHFIQLNEKFTSNIAPNGYKKY